MELRSERPLNPAYPEVLRTLGDHLRKKRLDLGLLQRDVAKVIEVDPTSIYNWENGRSQPSLASVPKIIRFLGYEPGDDAFRPLREKEERSDGD